MGVLALAHPLLERLKEIPNSFGGAESDMRDSGRLNRLLRMRGERRGGDREQCK